MECLQSAHQSSGEGQVRAGGGRSTQRVNPTRCNADVAELPSTATRIAATKIQHNAAYDSHVLMSVCFMLLGPRVATVALHVYAFTTACHIN